MSKQLPDEQPATVLCGRCGKLHATRYGWAACAGHVKAEYVDGVRVPLPLEQWRPCRRPPTLGATVCKMHGAQVPAVAAAAEDRMGTMHAERALREFGQPIDVTPSDALLDTVKWTAGYVAWLRERVVEIGTRSADELLGWQQIERTTTGSTTLVKHVISENAWSMLLGKWQDKLVKVCTAAITAGIEERRVRLAEEQGALVAGAIRAILGELDLTPDQAARAGEAVPRHLRALAG